MLNFIYTFVCRHPWTTAFLIWGLADTGMALRTAMDGDTSQAEEKNDEENDRK